MEDLFVEELRERLSNGETPEMIDVRESYEHDGFNIGGRNLPLGDIQAWMRDLSDLKQTELVLYCHSGIRSGMAAEFMRATGFPKHEI